MSVIKAAQRLLTSPRPTTHHCDAEGCNAATREGKPFCSDHVERHAYVQDLLGQIAEREAEDERVRKVGPKAANLKGITAQEILQHLYFNGPRTVERLSRELNLEIEIIRGYARALAKANHVTLGSTKRGAMVLKPTKPPPPAVAEALAAEAERQRRAAG